MCTTLCVGFFQPSMHKKFFIYNSEYKIVEQKQTVQKVTKLPEQVNKPPLKQKSKTISETKTLKTKKVEPSKQTTTVKTQKKDTPKVKSVVTKTVKKEATKAEQEVIQWNIWRSNLQNQIMKDAKLPITPEGTIFKFEFDVDKYGRIYNVKTWSTTSMFTPYAIQYIAPVIKGYQGHSILNFPSGSNRISTTVQGGWKISGTAKYSSPEDYRDFETIIKN